MDAVQRVEQRRHHRVPFVGLVRVDGVTARGVDVSMGGLRVKSLRPAPTPGTAVLVEFTLPHAGPVATRAEVVRAEDRVYVMRFLRLDPMTMVSLAKFFAAPS